MGYARRPDVPGATYHVQSRGTNKEPIFFTDVDRLSYLDRLEEAVERHGWVLLAYCLMTNHSHLVLRVPLGGLSKGMQWLNTGYSLRTNVRNGRSMHLFRQRFKSTAIESESHLLEACRYVVLNPVRAGLCDHPEQWRWSSFRGTAGPEIAPRFLAASELLAFFGRDRTEAERRYRAFVEAGLGQRRPVQVSDTDTRVEPDPR